MTVTASRAVLRRMTQRGLHPTVHHVCALAVAMAEQGDVQGVKSLMQRILRPNVQGSPADEYAVRGELIREGLTERTKTILHNALARAYARSGQAPLAMQVLKGMVMQGVCVDRVMLKEAIQVCMGNGVGQPTGPISFHPGQEGVKDLKRARQILVEVVQSAGLVKFESAGTRNPFWELVRAMSRDNRKHRLANRGRKRLLHHQVATLLRGVRRGRVCTSGISKMLSPENPTAYSTP